MPVALVVSVFAISNRQIVSLSFDIFSSDDPFISVAMPVYLLVLVPTFFGILIGGMSVWIAGSEVRRNARRLSRKTRKLERDLEMLRSEGTRSQQPPT